MLEQIGVMATGTGALGLLTAVIIYLLNGERRVQKRADDQVERAEKRADMYMERYRKLHEHFDAERQLRRAAEDRADLLYREVLRLQAQQPPHPGPLPMRGIDGNRPDAAKEH